MAAFSLTVACGTLHSNICISLHDNEKSDTEKPLSNLGDPPGKGAEFKRRC